MEKYDWAEFTKTINIKADIQDVYDLFSTRSGMESWFLRTCEYKDPNENICSDDQLVETGYFYTWRWYGWSDEVEENGKILQANGTNFFEYSFDGNGATNMIVTVTIEEEEAECLVHLKQRNIPTDEHGKSHWHLGCAAGWTFYLANLKSILEGGIDLRNRNPKYLKHKVINS